MIELIVICFGAFVLVMLLVVRAKRSHDQKRRRASASGFYDFDAAHYGTEGGSLMEKAVEDSRRPLAPSFAASNRGAGGAGKRADPGRPPTPAPVSNPMPVPSSFGVIDRSPAGPLPTLERNTGPRQGPVPSTPKIPPPPPPPPTAGPSDSPLPLLVQPPPPPPSDPPT